MPTERDNKVVLSIAGVRRIDYIWNSLCVTQGQPAKTPTATCSSQTWTIDLKAGRKKSAEVAQKFMALCVDDSHVLPTLSYFATQPAELNFFFGILLGIGSARVPVYLGQGSTALHNNWWVGGRNIVRKSGVTLLVVPDPPTPGVDDVYFVSSLSGSSNHFCFSSWF